MSPSTPKILPGAGNGNLNKNVFRDQKTLDINQIFKLVHTNTNCQSVRAHQRDHTTSAWDQLSAINKDSNNKENLKDTERNKIKNSEIFLPQKGKLQHKVKMTSSCIYIQAMFYFFV